MGEEQLKQTLELILEDYYYFTFEDFKVFFNNCRRGIYGTSYNRIDGQVILEWLRQYAFERSAEAETSSIVQAHSMKDRDVHQFTYSQVEKIINQYFKKQM